jgi:hypothetical protein
MSKNGNESIAYHESKKVRKNAKQNFKSCKKLKLKTNLKGRQQHLKLFYPLATSN